MITLLLGCLETLSVEKMSLSEGADHVGTEVMVSVSPAALKCRFANARPEPDFR
jgi:hypothetical protein